MKKEILTPYKIIQFVLCFFFLSSLHAQVEVCNGDVIMNVKGSWKKRSDANMKADKNKTQITNNIDAISKLFQEAYPDPKGMEAGWYRTMNGDPLVKNGPTPYQFSSLYLGWYCNENLHKLMLGNETGTWAYVYVNDFGWLMTDQWDKVWIKIDGVTAYLLPKTKEQWKGLPVYEPTGNNKSKAVLLTHNNQLPYKPVSRLSYLQSLKQKIENDKDAQMDVLNKIPDKSEAEEAAAKQKGLENALTGASASRIEERKERYLKNYKTDKEQKEENRQRAAKYYDDKIKIVEDLLKTSGNDYLQLPAIIDNNSNFKGFSTLEKGGRMIVSVNNEYFNLKLPGYTPQMIVLYWQWDNSRAAQSFKKQLEENFPVDILKALIDK